MPYGIASSPKGGAFSALLHRKAARQEVPFILYSVLSIAPRGGAVNKAAGKKKKAMEISIALLAPLA